MQLALGALPGMHMSQIAMAFPYLPVRALPPKQYMLQTSTQPGLLVATHCFEASGTALHRRVRRRPSVDHLLQGVEALGDVVRGRLCDEPAAPPQAEAWRTGPPRSRHPAAVSKTLAVAGRQAQHTL